MKKQNLTNKTKLFEILKNKPCYIREREFKKHFQKEYLDILTWNFPEHFKFKQKLYHYINDDKNLKLGLCKICGKRCAFKNLTIGYREFCSQKCSAKYIQNLEETKIKIKHTCLKKYGTENVFASEYGKNKIKETNLERYGVEYPMQSKEILEKSKQTCLKHYGVDNPIKSKIIQDKIKNACLVKYGKPYYSISALEEEIIEYIRNIYNGIIIQSERNILDGIEIDIFFPELNIGIEVNGDFWHMNPRIYDSYDFNTATNMYAFEHWEKDKTKQNIGKSKGVEIFTIWEYDWRNNEKAIKTKLFEILNTKKPGI